MQQQHPQHHQQEQQQQQGQLQQQNSAESATNVPLLSKLPSNQKQWLHQVAWKHLLKPATPRGGGSAACAAAAAATAAAVGTKPLPDLYRSVGHSAPEVVPQILFEKLRKYAMVYLTWRRNQPLQEMLTQHKKYAALQQEEEVRLPGQ